MPISDFYVAFFFWKEVRLQQLFQRHHLGPIPASPGTALLLAAKGSLLQGGLFWQGVWIAAVLALLFILQDRALIRASVICKMSSNAGTFVMIHNTWVI